jgi:hypothetical protein
MQGHPWLHVTHRFTRGDKAIEVVRDHPASSHPHQMTNPLRTPDTKRGSTFRCRGGDLPPHPRSDRSRFTNVERTPTMKSSTWHVEEALLLLMSGGFFVHLISASRHLQDDGSQVGDILLRPVDGALFLTMAYCAVVLILRFRHFFRAYDVSSTGRRLGYWAITAYVTLSLPGHILFLLTGDTRFFDGFPWWFSLVIMPVYVLVVAYVLTLRPRDSYALPAPAGRSEATAAAAERTMPPEPSPARP